MSEKKEIATPEMKDRILDINGVASGVKLNKHNIIYILIAVAVVILCTLLWSAMGLPSRESGIMLGLIIAAVVLWVSNMFDSFMPLLIFISISLILGLMTMDDIKTSLGKSQFVMMTGMLLVAQGAEQTPIARRIAYFFLYKFGKNQALMLLAIFLAAAVLSVFVSNLAATVVMASICVSIVKELEKSDSQAGKSFGRATMLMIPVGCMIGGMALISGAPGFNIQAIKTIENTSGGLLMSYTNWAKLGIPSCLIMLLPTWWIYKKWFKVPSTGAKMDASYFKKELDDIGGFRGSEVRWIITIFLMIGLMIAGFDNTIVALVCATITMLPVVGCMNARKAIKSLPYGMLLTIALMSTLPTSFTNYGISKWLADILSPALSGLSPFAMMLACVLILTILNNAFANASFSIITICMTIFTPVVMSLGMNPLLILFPSMCFGSMTNVLGVQLAMYLTYPYNYWEMKDTIFPGIITNIMWAVIVCLVAYLLGPVFGMSMYL